MKRGDHRGFLMILDALKGYLNSGERCRGLSFMFINGGFGFLTYFGGECLDCGLLGGLGIFL